jgi:hypothetical protein
MERKKIFLGATLLLFIAISVPLVFQQLNSQDTVNDISVDANSSEVQRTSDGTKYTVHPDELVQGCPSMDCIPSIDDPNYVSTAEADSWLNPEDKVIGVNIDNQSRAYPLRIMNKHEIVNTEVGNEPIVVTYCPLCRSGVTYSIELNEEVLEFGVSGKLRDANLVMYDRGTETYWSQIGGNAIIGPRVPQELELKFSSVTEWSEWKNGHPETQVLSRNTGIYPVSSYDSNPYAGYEETEGVGFGLGSTDERLPSKKLVYGVTAGGKAKAYTEDIIEEEGLIQDQLGGETVLVLKRPDDGTINAFRVKENHQNLNFTLEENGLRDSNEMLWDFEGEQVGGDGSMDKLNPKGFFWFAWAKFNPETQIYNNTEASS